MAKINITITTHNRAALIEHAVDAALQQIHAGDFTVTLLDDASTDNTHRIVKKYFDDPRFCYIRLGKNINQYQLKNLSLLLSDYDLITFHDSDDTPAPEKIHYQSQAFEGVIEGVDDVPINMLTDELPFKIDIVVSGCQSVYPDGRVVAKNNLLSIFSNLYPHIALPNINSSNLIVSMNHSMFRKEYFQAAGGYMPYAMSSDREMQARAVLFNRSVKYVDKLLYSKNKHNDSLTVHPATNMNSARRHDIHMQIFERIRRMRDMSLLDRIAEFKPVIDIPDLDIQFISNPGILKFNQGIDMSPGMAHKLRHVLALHKILDDGFVSPHGIINEPLIA